MPTVTARGDGSAPKTVVAAAVILYVSGGHGVVRAFGVWSLSSIIVGAVSLLSVAAGLAAMRRRRYGLWLGGAYGIWRVGAAIWVAATFGGAPLLFFLCDIGVHAALVCLLAHPWSRSWLWRPAPRDLPPLSAV